MNSLSHLLVNPYVLVGCGGAVGSCLRYAVGRWLAILLPSPMPLATTCVNIVGSLVLGCIVGVVANQRTHPGFLLLGVGFCGGFTTFSSFSMELVEQIQQGRVAFAVAECIANILLGVLAFVAGAWLFR